MTEKRPASALLEDKSIYPRQRIDGAHVAGLVAAMEAGEFSGADYPVIADRASLRIVDGFHRKRAWQKHFGADADIDVELRDYASDAGMLKEAVRLNSGHGRRLDSGDQARSAAMLRQLGVADTDIAIVLRIPPARVETVAVRVIIAEDKPAQPVSVTPGKPGGGGQDASAPSPLPAYRASQAAAALARELRSGRLDLELPGLRRNLADLAAVIGEVLG
jgi:hypothetical protein